MRPLSVFLKSLMLTAVFAVAGGLLFIWSGVYPMGADTPHNALTYWLLETLRERSIERSIVGIQVPDDLNAAKRLLSGAADYNDMCAGCHLEPGKNESDFTQGLYPTPPNLTLADSVSAPQRQFWIIKHGIKASGMPAWGPGHDDERIWNMVAFLQRLPSLNATQYQILSARKVHE
jgi:mono/diheme cytochrome c family protein